MATERPLIVIAGPTASGKSDLAMRIAKRYDAEIICADSRTLYKGLNIGTAKPTAQDQKEIKHWGIDLVEPGEHYSAAQFKDYALKVIENIRLRGKQPIIVGGTGLYIDAIVFDYQFPRQTAETAGLIDDTFNVNPESSKLNNPKEPILYFGVAVEKSTLARRINQRVEQMFKQGVADEAKKLGEKYSLKSAAMTGNAYRVIGEYLLGQLPESELKVKVESSDRKLAKRQMTWFRKNNHILWGTVFDIEHCINSVFTSE